MCAFFREALLLTISSHIFMLILRRQSPVNNDRTLSELIEPWNLQKWPSSDPTEGRLKSSKKFTQKHRRSSMKTNRESLVTILGSSRAFGPNNALQVPLL